ncbi:hypothetical protein [Pseudooceanicola sp.]|uniref:hypothetical protein n=1 Tax=Pseudooceanicola sp. TaxID=1914328 RepID=UPI0035C73165
MKPNFALILSMDGIALLQRSSPGWALVGEAYPDSPDLAKDMARLRDAADRLAPGEAQFKVVIPNDQIRYLSIPAGPADPAARQQAVEQALDGATPYALDELVIDHSVAGDQLQIAAVATETLQEADDFARSFGFTPVSFAAMPEGREYTGEPFFGTAHDVPDDIEIEPDVTAIRVSGRVKVPPTPAEPPVEEVAETTTATSDAPAKDATDETAQSPAEETPVETTGGSDEDSGPVSFSSRRATAEAGAATGAEAPLKITRPAEPRNDAPRITFAPPEAGKAPAPVVMPPRDINPEELSDSLKSDAPSADSPSGKPRFAAVLAAGSGVSTRVRTALADRRAARAEKRAKAQAEREEAARIKAEEAAAAEAAAQDALSKAEPPAPAEPAPAAPTPAPKPEGKADAKADKPPKRKGRKGKDKPTPPTDTPIAPPQAEPTLTVMPAPSDTETRGGDRRPGALTAEERKAEEERLTVFGARNATYDPGRGGSIGVVVAVVAAILVVGSVAWAALFSDASLSALFGRPDSTLEEVAVAPEEAPTESFVPPAPGDDTAADGPETAEDRAVQAALQESAAEPEAPAAEAPVEEEPPAEDTATAEEPVSPLIVTEAVTEEPPASETTASDERPGNGSTPDEGTVEETTTAEEEARYAASGIWQDSPEGIASSGSGTASPGTDSATDSDAPPTRGPSVSLAALSPDARPAPPAPPPVFGQRFDMDERGLVIPTEDGAMTPSGIMVFAGDPPVVPPPRPGEALEPEPTEDAQPEAEATPEATSETTPETAPEAETTEEPPSDAQLTEEPQPGAEAEPDPRFALVRPRLRPGTSDQTTESATSEEAASDDVELASAASLASGAVRSDEQGTALIEDEERASIAAGLASGADAVREAEEQSEAEAAADGIEPAFIALRPIQRPGNIGELAAAARATPEPPPAIAPSGPTAVSVARQATVRNALDLTEVNLIGVYGQPSDRRALVRLANGRYRKVQVGDRIDGGRVLAIGEDTLRYRKGNQNLTLNMPSG